MDLERKPASLTRRRFLTITAAVSGAGLLGRYAGAHELQTFNWHGVALGAQASLTLQHHDAEAAHAAIDAALSEIARLEQIFSLYRQDSALQVLNTNGRLDGAPADFVILLNQALRLAKDTGGAFDPSIQPLWSLYANHFSMPDADPQGPGDAAVKAALALVDWRNVDVSPGTIVLAKPGMSVTLNGIAQGYITDKVGALLKAHGFEHVLINMGEQLAIGPKWNGDAWSIGIADPADSSRQIAEIPLKGGAAATSGAYGFRFDAAGRFTHILDPHDGEAARQWASITVLAESAAVADGLSTALSVVPHTQAKRLLGASARAYAVPIGARDGFWLERA